MDVKTRLKLFYSLVLSPLLMFFEPYMILVKAIGILVILDIITGIMAARKEGKDITSRGLYKKIPIVGLFLLGLAAAKVSNPLLIEFGIEQHQAGKWLCSLYGIYELLSILENLGKLGLPVASQLADKLKASANVDKKD